MSRARSELGDQPQENEQALPRRRGSAKWRWSDLRNRQRVPVFSAGQSLMSN
jgi:hypothetical protein